MNAPLSAEDEAAILARAEVAMELEAKCRAVLRGNAPDIQGSVVVWLTAAWILGFPMEYRDKAWKMHIGQIEAMVRENSRGEIPRGPVGHG